jgi:hypothetical protein
MRYLILIVALINSLFTMGQSIGKKYDNIRLDRPTLPAYVIANESDTIAIAFTISDVQKIDKNLELLEYLEDRSGKIDTTLYYYVSLVGDLEIKVDLLKTKVLNLSSQSVIKDSMISDLKSQIGDYQIKDSNNKGIIENQKEIIDMKDHEVKKQKFLKKLYAGIGIVAVTVIVIVSAGSR